MFHHDSAHTGQSQFDTSANSGVLKWVYSFPKSNGGASPVLGADGTIYSTTGDDNLYAFNPDGTLKWTFTAAWPLYPSPAIGADGTIYAPSTGDARDGYLYAVNPDGTLRWTFHTGFELETSPAIASDGTIYVYCDDGNLYAINADGTAKWVLPEGFNGTNEMSSPAIGADGTIYFGSANGNLYAVNPEGTLNWAFQTPGDVESSPAVGADGTIYVGSEDSGGYPHSIGYLYALNPDGTLKWRYTTPNYWVTSSPAIGADGTIYFGDGRSISALNPNGMLKWQVYTDDEPVVSSPAIGADGSVYVGANDGNIYAFNADGSIKWKFNPGGGLFVASSPAIGADGTIYIYGPWDSPTGHLYAIGNGTPTPTPTPTPSGRMKLMPDQIRFPETGIGLRSDSQVLTIKNSSGSQHLAGMVGTLSPPFQVGSPGWFDLAPHSEMKDVIFFRPITTGLASQQLVIQSSDAENPSAIVTVSGTGAGGHLSAPKSISFPNTTVGSSASKKLMLKNTGKGMLSGSVGSLAPPFTVTAGGGSFGPLKPKAAATITITFQPQGKGATTPQTLSISTDPPTAGVVNVPVMGTGK